MSATLQPLFRLVDPTPRPDPARPEHLTHQDALRSLGAWLDVRGYTLDGFRRDGVDLIVTATLPGADEPDVLRLDPAAIARLRDAAKADRHRDARPPLYPVFE